MPSRETAPRPARNCGSRRDAGLDAATRGFRLSSVASSPANVRVERVSVEGASAIASSSAWLWRSIAPVAVLVLVISCVSWEDLAARAFIASAPLTIRPSKAGSSAASSWVTALVL
jgi:hypothetical protein